MPIKISVNIIMKVSAQTLACEWEKATGLMDLESSTGLSVPQSSIPLFFSVSGIDTLTPNGISQMQVVGQISVIHAWKLKFTNMLLLIQVHVQM